jgi:hypothetical protein
MLLALSVGRSIQKSVKSGNSSGVGSAVSSARPRADRPYEDYAPRKRK